MNEQAPANVFDEINSRCKEFRRQLKQGDAPRIEDYLGRVEESAQPDGWSFRGVLSICVTLLLI
jgi:hypothetical protein